MTKKPSTRRRSDLKSLDDSIRRLYPGIRSEDIRRIRSKVIDYIGSGLSDGWDIALIKRIGDKTSLRVLKMVEKPRSTPLLNRKEDEEI